MTTRDTPPRINVPMIEQNWPLADTEEVRLCPMCDSPQRSLAHDGVRDWAFECAPGSWDYWFCSNCRSMYLDPRPSISSIGRAYSNYYTHGNEVSDECKYPSFRLRLRNECMFHWFRIDGEPRLHLRFGMYLRILKPLLPRKFPLDQLMELRKGDLLDVGCGSGELILAAQAIGWRVQGIEIDQQAVDTACRKGLSVQRGSFEAIRKYPSAFDCVVCSHVIEHVHNPRELLSDLTNSLKTGGRLFIAYPNPNSCIRLRFGRYWRGLEAPRHLCLPSFESLTSHLEALGMINLKRYSGPIHTYEASSRAKLGRSGPIARLVSKFLNVATSFIYIPKHQDIIEIVCERSSS
jgi:2-polyprenyl-3-methyl-5-hydroxy-6-metoxy-1,4-benzoquinol methylase